MTAKAACPDLGERSEDGAKVQAATIGTLKCFEALKSALSHTDVAPHTLRLFFDETPARELYTRVLAAFTGDPQLKGIDAAFVGAALRLTGALTRDQRRRALLHADRETLGRAEGLGNPILYVGARTGRDGIRGATMASASFGEGSEGLRPTVQVGDPFYEKLLLECCLELFLLDVVVGIQDMGAAGLISSSSEMASRAGAGVRLQVDLVPRREEGMTPEDCMLPESQERMLIWCPGARRA